MVQSINKYTYISSIAMKAFWPPLKESRELLVCSQFCMSALPFFLELQFQELSMERKHDLSQFNM